MKQLKCHHCGSADLVLRETRYEHAEFDGGLFVNDRGLIEARGRACFMAGEIQAALTRIECTSCGREWRPRRAFAGTMLDEAAAVADAEDSQAQQAAWPERTRTMSQ